MPLLEEVDLSHYAGLTHGFVGADLAALAKEAAMIVLRRILPELTLKEETGFKCVYCESKIGHNTPGDIEHKIPSSKDEDQHFAWNNLTIACTECNRRKNDYYVIGNEFLDPYSDDVENVLEHHGPLVYWKNSEGTV